MKQRHSRGLVGVLAVGIIAVLAIGASSASASAQSVPANTVAFKAFVDNGFDAPINGVNGAVINTFCRGPDGDVDVDLVGTASNGLAKSNFNDEGGSATFSDDDLDNGESIPLNNGGITQEVIGHAEFSNGTQTRTMTVNYATEGEGIGPNGSTSDCAVTGSVIKGIY